MRTIAIAWTLAVFASPLVVASDIAPGAWEITMETRVLAEPGFAPPPFKRTQCLTAQDAADPSRLVAGLANPGATGCAYTNKSYSGSTFTFSMQCTGSFAIQASGQVSFTPHSMDGSIDSTAKVADKLVQTQNRISARRLGNC